MGPLREGAGIVEMIGAGLAQRRVLSSSVEGNTRMTVGLEHQTTVRALQRGSAHRLLATGAARHR